MHDVKKINYFTLFMFVSQLFWGPVLYMFPTSTETLSILTQLSLFIFPTVLYFIFTKESVRDTLSLKHIGFKNILIVIIISFTIQPTMALLSLISSFVFPNEVVDMMMEMREVSFPVMIFTIAIMPAICEEIFFRGLVLTGYKNLSETKACLMAGLLFGLMHMNGQQFMYAFVLGCIFAFLVRRCGSIFISMIGHFIINGTQVTGAYFIYRDSVVPADISGMPFPSEMMQLFSISLMVAISIPFFLAALWLFLKNNPKQEMKQEIKQENIFEPSIERSIESFIEPSNERVFFTIPIISIICFYLWFAIIVPFM